MTNPFSSSYQAMPADPQPDVDPAFGNVSANWVEPGFTRGGLSAPREPSAPAAVDLSAARTATGLPIRDASQLTNDCTVKVGGIETNVETAIAMGALVRDPATGMLRAAGNEPMSDQQMLDEAIRREQEQIPQQDSDAPTAQPLDEESEAYLQDAFTNASGPAMVLAADFIDKGGDISPHNLEQFASRLQIEPTEAARRVQHVAKAMSTEAAQVSARFCGTTTAVAEEALEHARQAQSPALKAAMDKHVNTGVADYRAVVTDYIASLGTTDPNRILNSNPVPGRSVRWDQASGTVVVTLSDGSTYSWENAVRAGLIGLK